VSKVLSEGQELDVKLIGFDRGKMKLSVKALVAKEDTKDEIVEEDKKED
jgi:polyribonucleotide nucleotidyltransferase